MRALIHPTERRNVPSQSQFRFLRGIRALTLLSLLVAAVIALPRTLIAGPIEDLVAQVDSANYRHLLDDLLFTHNGNNRGYGPDHDPARQNIFAHFESLGLATSLFGFPYGGQTHYNVVGVHEGYLHPEQIYIVGAHYDSANTPGADDNASGTACVMEIARVLASHRFEATIVFIAFDREEQGLIGSNAYATAHSGDDIRGMISADMIAFNPGGANRAAVYGRSASDPCKQALADSLVQYGGIQPVMYGAMDRSDHASFERQGFQAALLIENEWGSNPNYHRSTDSVDTPNYIDYSFATNMTRGVLGWLATQAVLSSTFLADPQPGLAGRVNQWTLTSGVPDTRTFFVYSLTNGTFEVPGCPGVLVGLHNPVIAGSTMSDAQGNATFRRFVPASATNRTVGVQAVQPNVCQLSNVDWYEFR